MAELVDARDSNSRFERSAGSIPVLGTQAERSELSPTFPFSDLQTLASPRN
jgi:hypothetical protein